MFERLKPNKNSLVEYGKGIHTDRKEYKKHLRKTGGDDAVEYFEELEEVADEFEKMHGADNWMVKNGENKGQLVFEWEK